MNSGSNVQNEESVLRAVAGSSRADPLPYDHSVGMQEAMERAGDPAEHWVVFPPPPLVARVIVGPVPDVPLAELAGFIEPSADDEGRIVDWVFNRVGSHDAADLKAYSEWRRSWERAWELGPLTNLRTLQRIVAGMGDVPRVVALLASLVARPEAARIEPSDVADLLTQLDAVRAAIAGDGRLGTAIVDQTPRRRSTVGFSRTWTTPDEPELVAANTTTAVLLDPTDGLVVVEQANGLRRITDVVETDLRGEVVVVTNRSGETIELEAAAARPLAWIVPASLRWKVRPIPEVVVWSGLFARLPDALRVAAATHEVISFTIDRDS
jgi:hypothetical protein